MKKISEFRYWFLTAIAVVIFVPAMAYQQLRAANEYKNHRTDYCSAHFSAKADQEACIEERTNADEYLDWRYSLFSFPSGITVWAIIGTGFAIVWQAAETRRSAKATEHASKAALLQIRLTKEKERARIEVKSAGFVLESDDPLTYWYLLGHIQIRNIGASRAFIRTAMASLHVSEGDEPLPELTDHLYFPSGYTDPETEENTDERPLHFFPDSSRALDGYSYKIFEGLFTPRIRGFIAYETLGVRFIRHFAFDWKSHKGSWIYAMSGHAEPTQPKQRIEAGRWVATDGGNYEEEVNAD